MRTLHGSCLSEALRIHGAWERLRMVLLGLSELLATVVADETVSVSRRSTRWMPWVKTVIPNGVDRAISTRAALRESIDSVRRHVPEEKARTAPHGTCSTRGRPVLPRRLWMVAEDAPEARNVTVLGRVSDDELAELYRQAWVFCLPSTYEAFGIPYVEAMASGCPVVATPNPAQSTSPQTADPVSSSMTRVSATPSFAS